ncbi:oxygen-independent coproporphyrinogen III oxidase [Alteromonas sp. H39]|uniref:oxygen-independent coproporphyrinogen III oxidase n=1 Tax=Alteromonas sp. H39 TaxID=3389876 RepID=UPI0039E1E52E
MHDLFDPALLSKYAINGPRYTSYPTALEFTDIADKAMLDHAAQQSDSTEISLYVHIPFCHALCYYCGCNKIVTRHQDKADRYLDYLEKELALRADILKRRTLVQLHLGGGSPSFLTDEQHTRLYEMINSVIPIASNCEMSIEIDPRRTTTAYLSHLATLGYNRLSIGVQDVDYRVQDAINRVQSTAHIASLVMHAKTVGFTSINLDLIYGLPHQTTETFATTMAAVKAMSADRISLFSYAHLPSRFAAQRKINDDWLPTADMKTALMKLAVSSLTQAGYIMIGMDHFARRSDELAIARTNGTLHRNFQGYTTRNDLDLLGVGVSSISAIGHTYGQNPKTLNDYYAALDGNRPLTVKGYTLTKDDIIRRDLIMSLMCNLHVDIPAFEKKHNLSFARYFKDEIQQLIPFINDELLTIDDAGIHIASRARLVIRVICMTFDAYLKQQQHLNRYSRVI